VVVLKASLLKENTFLQMPLNSKMTALGWVKSTRSGKNSN